MTSSQPAWQREPEFSPRLPRLQMWPFPNAWGALKYLFLLISAPLLSAHQQLCNLHLILLCVLAFQVFVEEGGDTGELGGSLFSKLCSYTWVVVSREPFKQEYQKHPEGSCLFSYVNFKSGLSCIWYIDGCICKTGVTKLFSPLLP